MLYQFKQNQIDRRCSRGDASRFIKMASQAIYDRRHFILPLNVVTAIVNPVVAPPWPLHSRDPEAFLQTVFHCIRTGQTLSMPWESLGVPWYDVDEMEHAKRIAWLYKSGPRYDPIRLYGIYGGEIDDYPLVDGNHRLYAAIIREDLEVSASGSGDPEALIRMVNQAFKSCGTDMPVHLPQMVQNEPPMKTVFS